MKLLRYGPRGQEKPGTLDTEGRIRDLSGHIADITPDQLHGPALEALKAIDPTTLPLVEGRPRYGVPINGVRKFLAIGLNFADHAAESNLPIPAEPVLFTKAVTCLNGPNDDVVIPRGSEKTDWEVELGVVIGKPASYVTKDQALDHVAGYVLINDVSERAYRIRLFRLQGRGDRLHQVAGQGVGRQGVVANSLTPATFESPILEQLPQSQVDYMRSKIPMGRLGEVDESAAMVCFMASEECSFTTASTFDTSGGRTTY